MPRPSSSVFLCGVPRTGTSLLAHLLGSTGVAGRPAEWFWRDVIEPNWKAWGVTSYDAYLDRVLEEGTTPNAVFAAKVMWGHLPELFFRLRMRARQYEASDLDVLSAVFPRPRFVWITRTDTVAQAVSWAKAIQTGQWASYQEATGTPAYDFEQIDWLHHEIRIHNGAWRRWFAAHGIETFSLTYEDLSTDGLGVKRQILGWLGFGFEADSETSIELEPEPKRQADSLNAEWIARYRAEARE